MAKSTKALFTGRIQKCKTNLSIAHIRLATHGRSIQIGSILSGAEDLVPVLVQDASGNWQRERLPDRNGYAVTRYRPRVEGLFSVIERWSRASDGDIYWRSISKDNVTTFYGKTLESRIAVPEAFRPRSRGWHPKNRPTARLAQSPRKIFAGF